MRTLYNVTYNGKKYKATVPKDTTVCFGCAFFEDPDANDGCSINTPKHSCTSDKRADEKDIIWVEVKK